MASLLASFEAMPMWQLVLVLTVGTIVLSIVLNVLYQVCVPQSKSLPRECSTGCRWWARRCRMV